MKAFVLSAVSIVLVGIWFCRIVIAAPSMPADVQMVQPDPSLPKELSAFLGKWEVSSPNPTEQFIIVEKIDNEKASLYIWRSGELWKELAPQGWERLEAKVIKEGRRYKLLFLARYGKVELTLKGDYLDTSSPLASGRLKRVP